MPRYAVISDIHSNRHALEAVLARIEDFGVDQVICLGDIVGYGPDPEVCVELVSRNCSVVIQGNHDLAVMDPRYTAQFNATARKTLDWTRNVLETVHLDALCRIRSLEYLGDLVTCVHDNPMPGPMTYVYDQQVASNAFRAVDTPICLVGHTHIPMVFTTRVSLVEDDMDVRKVTAYLPRDGVDIQLDAASRSICNPGSVGQPRDGDPRASFAVLDLDRWTFTVHRERYDVVGAQLALNRRGLPDVLAERLAIGA